MNTGTVNPAHINTELRPLSLGELLDRTAQLYRAHFLLFVGIAVFPRALLLGWQLVQIAVTHFLDTRHMSSTVFVVFAAIFAYVLYFAFVGLGVAAINDAVSAIYLGRAATIAGSYERVKQRWARYTGVICVAALYAWGPTLVPYSAYLVVMGAAGKKIVPGAMGAGSPAIMLIIARAGFLFLFTIPYGVWMSLRYSLAVPASIFEGIGVRAALKRSVALTKKGRGRIFLMALLVGIVFWTIFGAAQMPLFIILYKAAKTHRQQPLSALIASQVISFVLYSIIGPIYGIGITLFYYDERIRKEGFDIEYMMQQANLGDVEAAPTAGVPVLEIGPQ
ncbi:MAG TPA: glycerophosphoryl diester phosphodiesterase membrane domain-containing protein [Acidisarcina sp.]